MAAGYGELLRTRHAARLLGGTLLGRLPNGMAALAVVLFTRSHGGGYGLAGALSALYGLATALGQPFLGRAVDRRGQPRVMTGAALASAAGLALLATRPPRRCCSPSVRCWWPPSPPRPRPPRWC
jgi:MFS family permease